MLVQWSEYCAAVSFMFLILYFLAALRRSKLQCLNCARVFVCETGKRTSVSHPERRRTHKRTLCVHFGILKCVPYVCWMLCVHGAEVSIALATVRVFVLLLQHTYTHTLRHTIVHHICALTKAQKVAVFIKLYFLSLGAKLAAYVECLCANCTTTFPSCVCVATNSTIVEHTGKCVNQLRTTSSELHVPRKSAAWKSASPVTFNKSGRATTQQWHPCSQSARQRVYSKVSTPCQRQHVFVHNIIIIITILIAHQRQRQH